jgi:hypothetical protein
MARVWRVRINFLKARVVAFVMMMGGVKDVDQQKIGMSANSIWGCF